MNKEETTNHILIEVLNNNGDIKLTKLRNPRALWQDKDYPDECIFKDVDYVNIFQLIQENKQLKEEYENIINRYKFIRNRINQGMSNENKNICLIELGNQILREIDKMGDSNE